VDDTLRVSVEVPEPGAAMLLGLKLAVTPDGKPVADRLTAWLNPLSNVVVTVDVPEFPCWTVSDVGDTASVKFGGTATVRLTVVLYCAVPPLPVTVMV